MVSLVNPPVKTTGLDRCPECVFDLQHPTGTCLAAVLRSNAQISQICAVRAKKHIGLSSCLTGPKKAGTAFPPPFRGHFNRLASVPVKCFGRMAFSLLMQRRLAEASERIKKSAEQDNPTDIIYGEV
jgi:hypothetical protein